jgi:predicted esterase YcpF (UPF0227 family)
LDQVVLVGSSLGGFYATQLVAKLAVPAVLINPAMQPWHLFRDLFGATQLPYRVNEHWTLDDAQLDYLEQIELPFVQDADKILVLLQQGDEVLKRTETLKTTQKNQTIKTCHLERSREATSMTKTTKTNQNQPKSTD